MNLPALKLIVLFDYSDGKIGRAQRRKKDPQNYIVYGIDLEI